MTCQPSTISCQLLAISYALSALCSLLFVLTAAAEDLTQDRQAAEEKVYLVNDYRYVPANATDDQEAGLSLCGSRCNALSTDYRNISEAMGWLMIKGAANQELTVELNSPFIGGHCICIADEYLVKRDERNSIDNRRPRSQKGSAAGKPGNL